MVIMSVDPGKTGGIAVYDGQSVVAHPTPDSDTGIIELIRILVYPTKPDLCIFEQVGGYIGEKQPGSAMFTFGDINGFVRAAIKSHTVPVELVRPQTWQKSLCIPPRKKSEGESKDKFKDRLVLKARSLYPNTFEGLNKGQSRAIADAVLLIEYGRRLRAF